jgi:hypothetical protein
MVQRCPGKSTKRWTAVTTSAALGLVLAVPGYVAAATIYGTIRADSGPLANTEIQLVCGARSETLRTDGRGAYRFTVGQTGRCELRLQGGGSAPVILYNDPTRYDFEVRQEQGRRRLIRK